LVKNLRHHVRQAIAFSGAARCTTDSAIFVDLFAAVLIVVVLVSGDGFSIRFVLILIVLINTKVLITSKVKDALLHTPEGRHTLEGLVQLGLYSYMPGRRANH